MYKMVFLIYSCWIAQLASDKEADELLADTLLELSELSDAGYCARSTGLLSRTTKDGPSVRDMYVISSKHANFEFHSLGLQSDSATPSNTWMDALRDAGSFRKRFKIYTGTEFAFAGHSQLGGADRHKDLEMESEKQLKENSQHVWPWPELDPFGLVFGSEYVTTRRYSEFNNVRDRIARFEYEGSKVLKNRNTVGTWISPNHKTRYTIEFDRKTRNLPHLVKLELIENKQIMGLTKITWVKYTKQFHVPQRVTVTIERDDKSTVEHEYNWEWVPFEVWSSWCTKKNFERLFEPETLDFRVPFVVLFNADQNSKDPAR